MNLIHSFTYGIVQGIAEGSWLISVDWFTMARTVLGSGDFLQFKIWLAAHVETQAIYNRNNILYPLTNLGEQVIRQEWKIN